MTTHQLTNLMSLELICLGAPKDITCVYCCDLLSLAMVKAPKGCCWVTVIANRNTIAIAKHAEAACVVLAEGVTPSEEMCKAAKEQDIPLFVTALSSFVVAKEVDGLLTRQA